MVRREGYLGDVQLQTLDESIPPLGKAVQSCLQFTGNFFVLYTGQQVLAHGAQLVHGGPLRLQICFDRLKRQISTE